MLESFRAHTEVLWGFLLALAVVLVLTPGVGRIGRVLGIVDEPGERRRLHVRPVPRLGGIALFLGLLVPWLAFLDLSGPRRGILLGAAVAVVVGLLDDFRGLPWWTKLGGQAGAAGVAVGFGVVVDRLAAGIAAISGGTFAVIALSLGKPGAAVMSAIVAGACFGFLRHNFYPARIFMGDSGALLLGFVLATVAVQGLLKTAATVALFFPLLVLAIPILDTSFVVLRRLKHHEKVYLADQAHLHHRFLRRGVSQRRATVTMWAWCLTLAGAALATRFVPFREHGEWHLWPTVVVSIIGAFAIAVSVYVVYYLEIVKLGNPYLRRRDQQVRERLSA